MSNKQQTAVDWFISELKKSKDFHRVINEINERSTSVRDVIKEAKEMQENQIKNAFKKGYSSENFNIVINSNNSLNAEKYYNTTYKKL